MLLVLTLSLGMAMNVQAVTVDEAQKKADELNNKKVLQKQKNSHWHKNWKQLLRKWKQRKRSCTKKQEEIQKAEEELLQAKVDENAQYQSMKKRIKFMYENGNSQ